MEMAARQYRIPLLAGVLLWLSASYVTAWLLWMTGILDGVPPALAVALMALGGLLLVVAIQVVSYVRDELGLLR